MGETLITKKVEMQLRQVFGAEQVRQGETQATQMELELKVLKGH